MSKFGAVSASLLLVLIGALAPSGAIAASTELKGNSILETALSASEKQIAVGGAVYGQAGDVPHVFNPKNQDVPASIVFRTFGVVVFAGNSYPGVLDSLASTIAPERYGLKIGGSLPNDGSGWFDGTVSEYSVKKLSASAWQVRMRAKAGPNTSEMGIKYIQTTTSITLSGGRIAKFSTKYESSANTSYKSLKTIFSGKVVSIDYSANRIKAEWKTNLDRWNLQQQDEASRPLVSAVTKAFMKSIAMAKTQGFALHDSGEFTAGVATFDPSTGDSLQILQKGASDPVTQISWFDDGANGLIKLWCEIFGMSAFGSNFAGKVTQTDSTFSLSTTMDFVVELNPEGLVKSFKSKNSESNDENYAEQDVLISYVPDRNSIDKWNAIPKSARSLASWIASQSYGSQFNPGATLRFTDKGSSIAAEISEDAGATWSASSSFSTKGMASNVIDAVAVLLGYRIAK